MKIKIETTGQHIGKYYVLRTSSNFLGQEYLGFTGDWQTEKFHFNTYHSIQRSLEKQTIER